MPNLPLLHKIRRRLANLRGLSAGRRQSVIAHAQGAMVPMVPSVVVPDIQPTDRDCAIAERLLAAYNRCAAEESKGPKAPADVWSTIKDLQSTFREVLSRNDPPSLAAYLCNMNRHDATMGTVQGDMEFRKIQSNDAYRQFIALMAKDKLVSLAEAIGAIPCENPEQGPWGESLHMEIDVLVGRIERTLGMDISPPPIDGGLFKIQSSRALFNERDVNAIFTAWSMSRLFASVQHVSIGEIGAGSGRVAYWSQRLGVGSYTIIDLPLTNVIQGFYLLKSLPAVPIVLFGEPVTASGQNGIQILPHFAIDHVAPDRFDLVLNQDSFPEIDRDTVLHYLAWIRRVSKRFFYSINHESCPRAGAGTRQLNVPGLIAEAGGYQRIARVPYWLRRGYVAELYEVCDKVSVPDRQPRPGSS